jgi:hypothetical protein
MYRTVPQICTECLALFLVLGIEQLRKGSKSFLPGGFLLKNNKRRWRSGVGKEEEEEEEEEEEK